MFRYVAFVWNEADPEACSGARLLAERLEAGSTGWNRVLRNGGLEVFCKDARPASSEPHLLDRATGVVLGRLFVRGNDCVSSAAPLAIGEAESTSILASAGRRLFDAFWGRYVAFLRDPARDTTWILRDPTGGMPCFTARLSGVDVYFSHMEQGAQLGGGAFSINWKYVAASLCQFQLQVHATGLNEVSQVLGGECLATTGGQTTRQFYWSSLDVAASETIEDEREATQLLRIRTRDCVQAWASGHRSIVHLLSGGLDSSIVLACLRDSPTSSSRPRVTCLNVHSPGSNTDERHYARLAASGTDCEVIERPRNSTVSLERLLEIHKTCIPSNNVLSLGGGSAESEFAFEQGASVVFNGYGGDQIFYQSRARYAAADYLARHGLGPALFNVALDAARVDRMSVWGVLGQATTHGLLRQRWSQRQELGDYRPLLRSGVVQDIRRDETLLHPWFRAPRGIPSGKLWQAHQLLFPMELYHPLGSEADPEPVSPLLSQPLFELVLRIPTWLLTLGGWDRALARRAFQQDVPRGIVTRRTKGGQEEHAKSILVRHLGFARELLLSGALVREKILDGDRVADVLSGRPTRQATSPVELYACLGVEAWLRQWHTAY